MTRFQQKALLAVGTFMLMATTAHAASFDCAQAKSKVEHLICNDSAISTLDNNLDSAYRSTLEIAAEDRALVQSQREWLALRNRCGDVACLAQQYRDRIAAINQVPQAEWKTYRNAKLGISFEYLANRHVKPCQADPGDRCVVLMGRHMAKNDYLIAFRLKDGPLEKVATEEAGFDLQDGKWVTTYGRGGSVDVEKFSGHGWKGMQATIACGVSDPETGFHAVGGECYWAVLSNGKRAVVADTPGVGGTDANTMRSVQSWRFEP